MCLASVTRRRENDCSDLTLEKAIDVVQSAEATERPLRDMASDLSVHGIGIEKRKTPFRRTPSSNEDRFSSSKIFNCRNCEIRHGVREYTGVWQVMSLLQETASFQEHVPVTKKSPWANGRRRRRRVSIVCRISHFRSPDSEYRMICDFISTRTAHAIKSGHWFTS